MPVYDYSYRTWQGRRSGPLLRWLAIPKYTFMGLFAKRMFMWLFTTAWLQFVLRAAYIYLLVNPSVLVSLGLPQEALPRILPQIGPFFFKNMIDVQLIFCFLFAFAAGADLISRDLAHRAFVLYAAKPFGRWEYFLGKFLTLFGVMMVLTWFQTSVLYGLQVAMAPPRSPWRLRFWHDFAWIFPAIALYSTVVSAALSLMVLAVSSLVKQGRYAGIALLVYIFGASTVAAIVADVLRTKDTLALSPFLAAVDLGFHLFRIRQYGSGIGLGAAWAGVLGVCALSGLVLWWRLERASRYGD